MIERQTRPIFMILYQSYRTGITQEIPYNIQIHAPRYDENLILSQDDIYDLLNTIKK